MTADSFSIYGPNAADKPFSEGAVAGDLFFTSGITAPADGEFAGEVDRVLDELERRLTEVSTSFARLVKVNVYLSEASLMAEFNEAYMRRIAGVRPPRTTIVTGFPIPNVRLEIDAVAYLG